MPVSSKVIVIGKGRFGNATAQGLREGFIEKEDGMRMKCDVIQVSATRFTSLSISEMADELEDTAFVAYCGTRLSEYSGRMAAAIQLATKKSTGPPLEFIDFSNPDPINEKADVSGAVDLWVALSTQGRDEEVTKHPMSSIKVWKVTEVGSVDVSGICHNTGTFSKCTQIQLGGKRKHTDICTDLLYAFLFRWYCIRIAPWASTQNHHPQPLPFSCTKPKCGSLRRSSPQDYGARGYRLLVSAETT